MVGYAVIERSK